MTNLHVRATKQGRAADVGERDQKWMKNVLDNSLFIRLVSVRPNHKLRKGGSHDHWTDDAW